MSSVSVLAKADVHLAKGRRAQREFENALRRAGYAGAVKFCGDIAHAVARDSRLEYARRVKKMKRRSATIDMFEK